MDYKKKYEEALERAKDFMDGKVHYALKPGESIVCWIFPELRKNEDEKIREDIIYFLSRNTFQFGEDIDKYKTWISWLEKQGEQKPNKTSIWKHWSGNSIAGNGDGHKIYLIKRGITYEVSSCLAFECDYIELSELDKLLSEKQGEPKILGVGVENASGVLKECIDKIEPKFQEGANSVSVTKGNTSVTDAEVISYPTVDFKSEDWYVSKVDGKIHNIHHSVDKLEPKFKVGDWFVNNVSKDIFLIKSVNNGYCILEDVRGKTYQPCLPPIEGDNHLWTIEDAKDGDVLANDNYIMIYNDYENKREFPVCVHCVLSLDSNIFFSSIDALKDTNICPATKEQCELIFQKMKEAGYEWDVEKKELKKIDARENLILDGDLMEADCMIVEKKPTWSEEDEHGLGDALWAIELAGNIAKDESDMSSLWYAERWLKSLKQRMKGE